MKVRMDNDWLSTSQSNENGTSRGGWDGSKNKWTASVCAKPVRDENGYVIKYEVKEHYESISHQKVSDWLNQKRKLYELR